MQQLEFAVASQYEDQSWVKESGHHEAETLVGHRLSVAKNLQLTC